MRIQCFCAFLLDGDDVVDGLMKEFPALFLCRGEEPILEGFVSQVFLNNNAQFSIQGDDFRNRKTDLAEKMLNLLIRCRGQKAPGRR